jgi:alpha-galactosidase
LVDLDSGDPLGPYLDLVGRYSSAQANAAAPVGWCSWYHAFQRVDEDLILANLTQAKEAAAQFPLDIIQVDDGYQRRLGDWFETGANFPRGMPKLRKEISEGGFTAGIWLAPFVANWRSHLVRAHPDWILRNRLNIPVNPGFIFDSLNYPLDITHPGVRAYVRNIVGQVTQAWGYEYLKLDFLYAGALSGVHYDPTVTRAQALFHALQDIRHAAGEEVFLLGCGGPLGSGIGIFDAMRINPDVSPRWNPSYWGIEKFLHSEEGHPSTRNAILTTINRLPLHRRWWVNDPDCLLLRSEDTHLTPAQVQTLATVIALSAGSLIISDDLGKLSQERRQWLSRLIPPLPDAARALDWFDTRRPGKLCLRLNGPLGSWVLFARINWRDEPVDCVLDLDEIDLGASFYHGVDFWREEYLSFQEPNTLGKIPPHGVRLFAMREEAEGAQWLGDTLHISQGLEVKSWEVKEEGIAVELEPGHHVRGSVWLKMPWVPQSAELDGQLVTWKRVGDRIYKFELTARRKSKFAVRKH